MNKNGKKIADNSSKLEDIIFTESEAVTEYEVGFDFRFDEITS
jgi:hypothetical protein